MLVLTAVVFPIGAILACVFEERVGLSYGVCRVHQRKRWIRTATTVAVALAGFMLVVLGGMHAKGYGWLIAVGLAMIAATVVYGAVAVPDLKMTGYRDGQAWIKGAGEAFLDQVHAMSLVQAHDAFEDGGKAGGQRETGPGEQDEGRPVA